MFDCNHILEVLATSFFETLSPTRCVVCDTPGAVLCNECATSLPYIDPVLACPRCGAPYGARLCTECPIPGSEETQRNQGGVFPFIAARAALSYERGVKKLIRTYKDGDELRLDMTIASLICQALRGRVHSGRVLEDRGAHARTFYSAKAPPIPGALHTDWTQWADAIVTVPATAEAMRRRGFDHMKRVGALCSSWTGLPHLDALACTRHTLDQRALGRGMRFENRSGSFSAVDTSMLSSKRIILVDDVFTTGATTVAATNALLAGGASQVAVAVCARVW